MTRRNHTQLYVAVAAAVHAALMGSPTWRNKPQAAAHRAAEHAQAAVDEMRMRGKRK